MKMITILAVHFLLLTQAHAEETDKDRFRRGDPGARTAAGIAVGNQSNVYKAGNNPFPVLPILSLKYEDFYFQGITAGYRAIKDPFQLHFTLSPNLFRLKPEDGTYTEGLHKRYPTLHAGVRTIYPTKYGVARLAIEQDILGKHKGQLLESSFIKPFSVTKKWLVTPGVFFHYLTAQYVDYYFGVNEDEIRADRAYYKGKGAFQYGPSLFNNYMLTENWNLTAGGNFGWYTKEVYHSPLVARNYRYLWFFGVTHAF